MTGITFQLILSSNLNNQITFLGLFRLQLYHNLPIKHNNNKINLKMEENSIYWIYEQLKHIKKYIFIPIRLYFRYFILSPIKTLLIGSDEMGRLF